MSNARPPSTPSALRRRAWLVLWVMLAAALLPTLGRAMAAGHGSATHWAEVCTPQGMRLVAMADPGPEREATPPAEARLEHCALCLLAAQPLLGPPEALPSLSAPLAGPAPSSSTALAPPARQPWGQPQPRGPPRLA